MNFEKFAVAQLVVTLYSMVAGVIAGLIYDVFRVIRHLLDKKRLVSKSVWNVIVVVQDVLFWIIAAVLIVAVTMSFGEGQFRFYIFGGSLGGFLIYLWAFSSFFQKTLTTLIVWVAKIVLSLLKLVVGPIAMLLNIVWVPVKYILLFVKNVFRKLKQYIFLWWMKTFIVSRVKNFWLSRKKKRELRMSERTVTKDKTRRRNFTV